MRRSLVQFARAAVVLAGMAGCSTTLVAPDLSDDPDYVRGEAAATEDIATGQYRIMDTRKHALFVQVDRLTGLPYARVESLAAPPWGAYCQGYNTVMRRAVASGEIDSPFLGRFLTKEAALERLASSSAVQLRMVERDSLLLGEGRRLRIRQRAGRRIGFCAIVLEKPGAPPQVLAHCPDLTRVALTTDGLTALVLASGGTDLKVIDLETGLTIQVLYVTSVQNDGESP